MALAGSRDPASLVLREYRMIRNFTSYIRLCVKVSLPRAGLLVWLTASTIGSSGIAIAQAPQAPFNSASVQTLCIDHWPVFDRLKQNIEGFAWDEGGSSGNDNDRVKSFEKWRFRPFLMVSVIKYPLGVICEVALPLDQSAPLQQWVLTLPGARFEADASAKNSASTGGQKSVRVYSFDHKNERSGIALKDLDSHAHATIGTLRFMQIDP